MRTGAELRRLTEAEKERVDGHAVDAEEHARDYVRRDYDDLQPHTPWNKLHFNVRAQL